MRCPTCKGSGQAPDKIKLECVECQCSVTIVFNNTAELLEKSDYVLCRDCRASEERKSA